MLLKKKHVTSLNQTSFLILDFVLRLDQNKFCANPKYDIHSKIWYD